MCIDRIGDVYIVDPSSRSFFVSDISIGEGITVRYRVDRSLIYGF